jgi:hypothetical protein
MIFGTFSAVFQADIRWKSTKKSFKAEKLNNCSNYEWTLPNNYVKGRKYDGMQLMH